jgi:hypothetical protein
MTGGLAGPHSKAGEDMVFDELHSLKTAHFNCIKTGALAGLGSAALSWSHRLQFFRETPSDVIGALIA